MRYRAKLPSWRLRSSRSAISRNRSRSASSICRTAQASTSAAACFSSIRARSTALCATNIARITQFIAHKCSLLRVRRWTRGRDSQPLLPRQGLRRFDRCPQPGPPGLSGSPQRAPDTGDGCGAPEPAPASWRPGPAGAGRIRRGAAGTPGLSASGRRPWRAMSRSPSPPSRPRARSGPSGGPVRYAAPPPSIRGRTSGPRKCGIRPPAR